jgi:hypothetical protein
MLTLLYNYAEIFEGDIRKRLFHDFLIAEHFFNLFLHWDDNVRNAFQQFLVFKVCFLFVWMISLSNEKPR